MTTISANDIRRASSSQRLPLLSQLFTELGGRQAGETGHLFGCGASLAGRTRDGHPLISIGSDVVARQLDELVRLEEMGGNIRYTVERLLIAHTGADYAGVTYLN